MATYGRRTPKTEDAVSGNESGRSDYRNAGGKTPSIPLSDADRDSSGEASVGSLVKNATASVSTLFRS